MFLLNSRLGLFTAASLRWHPFSRTYGVILPSSLTIVLSDRGLGVVGEIYFQCVQVLPVGGGVGELHAAVVAQPDGGLAEERRQGGGASAVQADQPLVASANAPKEPEEIPGALPDVPEEEIVDVGLFPQDVSVLGSGQERQPDSLDRKSVV